MKEVYGIRRQIQNLRILKDINNFKGIIPIILNIEAERLIYK